MNTKSHANALELHDTQQSAWQLSAIQLSGWTTLPILSTSVLILQNNSFYGSILTIIVGNAILWFIRLGIILMSYKNRQSTLDISLEYLGRRSRYFMSSLLVLSTLIWFIAQTTAASNTLTHLITIDEHPEINKFVQMSVLVGILSSFLCMEGITLLRKLSVIAFPIILLCFLVIVFTIPFQPIVQNNVPLSLSGLALFLGGSLGITTDLPTFFRHSKSLQSSVIALTIVQLITLGLSIGSLYFGALITGAFDVNEKIVLGADNQILRLALIIFIFVSSVTSNVANVYAASVGWEVIAPTALVGRKEYMILGLGLTTIFILIPDFFSMKYLLVALESTDNSLVYLCIVLVIGFLVKRKTGPDTFDQSANFLAWFLATLVTTYLYLNHTTYALSPISIGTILIFLTLIISAIFKRFVKKHVFR